MNTPEHIAYHESGHAVMAFLFKRKLQMVTISAGTHGADARVLGFVSHTDSSRPRMQIAYRENERGDFEPCHISDEPRKSEKRKIAEAKRGILIAVAGALAEMHL